MPVFEYSALDVTGKKIQGIVDADSLTAARQKIRHNGQYPVDIKEANRKKVGRTKGAFPAIQFGKKIKQQEIHVATRQLATLLDAGIPLINALNGLIEQTANKNLQKILAQIKDTVNEGNSLTKALEEHPKLFSRIYINMVRAGEASGSLDVVLERLAEFGEAHEALKSRIKAALIYPIFMAIVGSLVLFALITFIVPSITQVFEGTEKALPLPTTLLIAFSDFLQSYWWLLLFVLSSVILGLRIFINRPKGRRLWDKLKLNLPMLRDLNTKIAAARFGRTMGSLLQSGVPLTASLQIVKNILNNVILADVLTAACDELEKGRSLSQILRESKWFSPMLIQMIAVGEQSGALEKMLGKVADNYEKEVESKIMSLTALIEPVMILFMGLVVSFIVVSILLPIFEMNQLIR